MRPVDWDEKWRDRLTDGRHAETTGVPNRFLVGVVEAMHEGRALDLACGAGRNAVWLVERGWSVIGVDFSEVALATARHLATERGVEVEWIKADVLDYVPEQAGFDLVLVLYLQLPSDERRRVLTRARDALLPGGTLLVVGHDSSNLSEGYGGPKNPDVLFTAADIAGDVAGLVIRRAQRVERAVSTDDGERIALDALVLAQRPDA